MKRRLIPALLCLTMCLALLPAPGQAAGDVPDSGVTEEGLAWARERGKNTVAITGWDAELLPADVTVPGEIHGLPVTSIGKNAFQDCQDLVSIALPESITDIGEGAFFRCQSLEAVTLPEGLTRIPKEAFSGCIRLKEIVLPETLVSIGDLAFSSCSSLSEINIPKSVRSLGRNAFAVCNGLLMIRFQHGFHDRLSFGTNCFDEVWPVRYPLAIAVPDPERVQNSIRNNNWKKQGWDVRFFSLDEVSDLPAGEDGGFRYRYDPITQGAIVTGFTNGFGSRREFPARLGGYPVTAVADSALESIEGMEEAVLPDTLQWIGRNAFSCSYDLHSVRIPESVRLVGYMAFSYCSQLREVRFLHGAEDELILDRDCFEAFEEGTRLILRVPDPENPNRAVASFNWDGNRRHATLSSPEETEEELRSLLAEGDICVLTNAATLDGDLEIPPDAELWILGDGELTVPQGVTLTNEGVVRCAGSITVRAGGTLVNERDLDLRGGRLFLEKDAAAENRGAGVAADMGGIQGPGCFEGPVDYSAELLPGQGEEALREWLDAGCTDIVLWGDLSVKEDLTIPEEVYLNALHAELTVEEGATLTLRGHLTLQDCTLRVKGELKNQGQIRMDGSGALIVTGTLTGNGQPWDILLARTGLDEGAFTVEGLERNRYWVAFWVYDQSFDMLAAACRTADIDEIEIWGGDLTLEEDLTIPEGVELNLFDCSLTVPEGVTMTTDGKLFLYNRSRLNAEGTVRGNLPVADSSSTVAGTEYRPLS